MQLAELLAVMAGMEGLVPWVLLARLDQQVTNRTMRMHPKP